MSSPGRRVGLGRAVGGIVFVAAATLLQLPRQSGTQMWRTVWAEDGQLFYADALTRPLGDTLFDSYAGYAHVVPRLLAWIGTQLPPEQYSIFVTVSGALATALLALFVYYASAPLLRSRTKQAILTLALLFWPVLPFEITGTITNIQWAMPMACLLAVLLPVDTPIAIAVRIPIVLLAPLSSPLCVLFVPVAAWHIVVRFLWRREGSGARLVVPVLYTIAAMGQLFVWWISPQASLVHPTATSFAGDVTRLYATRVSTELLFGVRVTEGLWERVGYLVAVVATAVIGAALVWRFVRATSTARWFMALCVAASLAIFASSIWQRAQSMNTMLPVIDGDYSFAGMRYQLFPAALVLLALLVPTDLERGAIVDPKPAVPRPLREDLVARRFAVGLALVWMLVAFLPSYRLDNDRSRGPVWDTGVTRAEQACADEPTGAQLVPVSPPGPDWAVAIPCSELDD